MRVRRRTCEETCWRAACHRLVRGFEDGRLVLEREGGEVRFRYAERPTGPVLRRNGSLYAAIIAFEDWPYRMVKGQWEFK